MGTFSEGVRLLFTPLDRTFLSAVQKISSYCYDVARSDRSIIANMALCVLWQSLFDRDLLHIPHIS